MSAIPFNETVAFEELLLLKNRIMELQMNDIAVSNDKYSSKHYYYYYYQIEP